MNFAVEMIRYRGEALAESASAAAAQGGVTDRGVHRRAGRRVMQPIMLSLFDYTTVMCEPWAAAGYLCYAVDIQHPKGEHRDGNLIRVGADIRRWLTPAIGGDRLWPSPAL